MSWRIGVDIGGTFTDLVAHNAADGRTVTAKALSTPQRPVEGVLSVVENAALSLSEASTFVHGSTVAINAILQQNGAPTALLTTRGFRDVLEMGRKNRADMYNLFFKPRVCLVPRRQRYEVDERLGFDGGVLTPLDLDAVADLAESLPTDIEAIAICFLHAYANPQHERAAAEALRAKRPDLYVTTSTDVSGEAREYERTSTAVANAYVGPLVARYVGELESELGARGLDSPLLITQSNGGVMPPSMAIRQPIRTTESGPAAGVNGAAWLGDELDLGDLIAFDMGGTTAKACVVRDGEPDMAAEYSIGGELTGIPVQVPFIEVVEVGAGGGSIAYVDPTSGGLRVGPRSAGAEPGPAAYARGGVEPTVTDANVVVGKIAPASFLDGKMALDADAAATALGRLADELEIDVHDCANGVIRVANAIMSAAIRAVTIERGRDPRDFTLVAYGGAGPVHAIALADELNIPSVVIPARSGTFAAFGMLVTNLRHDVARTLVGRLDRLDAADTEQRFQELEADATGQLEEFSTEDAGERPTSFRRWLDLRYVGQFHTLTLPLPDGAFPDIAAQLPELFHAAHMERYGHHAPEEPIEVITARVTAISEVDDPDLNGAPSEATSAEPQTRRVLFEDGEWRECAVLRRTDVKPGEPIHGPAVIEDGTTNIVLNERTTVERVAGDHLLVTLRRKETNA